MNITLNGKTINAYTEHELMFDGFGVDVLVTYKKDSATFKAVNEHNKLTEKPLLETLTDLFHNCTEVHSMYEGFLNKGTHIAFESDIHRTGGNRPINEIESVIITTATKKHLEY